MTIITLPNRDKGLEKPLAAEIIDPSSVNLATSNDSQSEEMELWLSPSTRRRISTTTTVCVFITALIVMSIGIIGGVYLYRQMTQNQRMTGFTGWCGIPYEKDSLHFSRKNSILGPNRPFFKEDNHVDWGRLPGNMFREEFDLDLSSGLFMKISVPDFGYGMRVQFLHDFKFNKTGIVLHSEKKCYVMPLDRQSTKAPIDVFDLVRKMWDGSHNINRRVIYKKMRIIHPAITDFAEHGHQIEKYCSNYATYMLREVKARRFERSVIKTEKMAEFAGNNIVEFTIEDSE